MKARPSSGISERQLALLLAAGGRPVSLTDLGNWRRKGLLPPLTARGLGPGCGRAHCWHEADIMAQAQIVFDTLERHHRAEAALLALFLSGFAVPSAPLRRAWASSARSSKHLPLPLVMPLLDRALARLGYRPQAAQMCHTVMAMAAALDIDELVLAVEDDEQRDLQAWLVPAMNFLTDCSVMDKSDIFIKIGPLLFAVLLSLLHSGQRATIEEISARIAMVEYSRPPRRARTLQMHAAD